MLTLTGSKTQHWILCCLNIALSIDQVSHFLNTEVRGQELGVILLLQVIQRHVFKKYLGHEIIKPLFTFYTFLLLVGVRSLTRLQIRFRVYQWGFRSFVFVSMPFIACATFQGKITYFYMLNVPQNIGIIVFNRRHNCMRTHLSKSPRPHSQFCPCDPNDGSSCWFTLSIGYSPN